MEEYTADTPRRSQGLAHGGKQGICSYEFGRRIKSVARHQGSLLAVRSAPQSSDRCDSYTRAKVAMAALSSQKTITEPCSEFGVHQTLIYKWMRQLKVSVSGIFR